MTNLILFLVVLVLLGYVIERNHRRHRPARMYGSVEFEDRDERRVLDDLRAQPAESVTRVRVLAPRRPLWTVRRNPLRNP